MRIGLECERKVIDGRSYVRVAPFLDLPPVNLESRRSKRIAAFIAITAFVVFMQFIFPDVTF